MAHAKDQQTAWRNMPAGKSKSRSVRRSIALGAVVLLSGGGIWLLADWWTCLPDDVVATFVGRGACVECHAKESEEWTGSDHDRAMDLATEETVLGDFKGAELTHHGITSRMYRDGPRYMIRTEGPDGEMADFEIKYVFGIRPLQQYMVEFDRPRNMPDGEIARVQVLRVSWDTERNEWFYLPAPDVDEKLEPDDDLHWTGIAQRWNNMCAYCHSTDLQKNYDVESLSYHTTFAEIDVSCEACHGPGSVHVQLAKEDSWFWDRKRGYGLPRLKSPNTQAQIQSCAPCHSRRRVYHPDFRPGDNYYDYFDNELLEEATYYADGQIMDEDYVFGSFIQSKMFHNDICCTDCHNPHTARLKQDGNKVCTSCHQHAAAKYDTPAHHFHKSDSTGASCAECHMPETTYMEVDPRRDHSIRIPRPDLSVTLGTPNACTRCHLTDAKISDEKRQELKQYRDWMEAARAGDQEIKAELERLDKWMLESMEKWYEKSSWGDSFAGALVAGRTRAPHAAEQLASVARDRKLPGIVRATAIHQRGLLMTLPDLGPEVAALKDEDPQVRAAAVGRFVEQIPHVGSGVLNRRDEAQWIERLRPIVRNLGPLLEDPSRVVRAETGRVLARLPSQIVSRLMNGQQRRNLDAAIEAYIVGVNESNDRGGAHMELAMLYESMGRDRDAEREYRTAIRMEPLLTGPRSNLAALLDRKITYAMQRLADREPTEQVVRDQREAKQLRREELDLLARDARLLPGNAAIQHRYGLSLYLNGQAEEAEKRLANACRLAPDNDYYLLVLATYYHDFGRFDEALKTLDQAVALRPGNRQYLEFRKTIQKNRAANKKPATK